MPKDMLKLASPFPYMIFSFCSGEKGASPSTGKPLHYKGSFFHRILKGSIVEVCYFSILNTSTLLFCNVGLHMSYHFVAEHGLVVVLFSQLPLFML